MVWQIQVAGADESVHACPGELEPGFETEPLLAAVMKLHDSSSLVRRAASATGAKNVESSRKGSQNSI